MTRSNTTGDLLRFGLKRLLEALGLAVSVVLLLFFILESGVAGDPALRMAGEHSSPERLADARMQLGFFEQWQAEAMYVDLNGPAARFYLLFPEPEWLEIQSVKRQPVHRIALSGLTINELKQQLADLSATQDPAKGELWNHHLSLQLGADVKPEASAVGLGYAHQGVAVPLQSARTATLSWAEPRSPWKRFLSQTASLLRFDFGRSMDGQLIGEQIGSRALRSLAVTLPAFVLGTILAVVIALLSTRRSWGKRLASMCLLGMTISSLAWVLFLRKWLAADLGWFPVAGWDQPLVQYLALPALIWTLLYFFPSYLIFRQLFAEQSNPDRIAAAEAKGLHGWPLLWNHVAKPAGGPVIAQIVLVFPFLVLGSLLLESVFAIPGLGSYTVDAALAGDAPVLRATTFLMALLYLLCQWLGDWLTAAVDPRTREAVPGE